MQSMEVIEAGERLNQATNFALGTGNIDKMRTRSIQETLERQAERFTNKPKTPAKFDTLKSAGINVETVPVNKN